MSRTSIYRALGQGTSLASPSPSSLAAPAAVVPVLAGQVQAAAEGQEGAPAPAAAIAGDAGAGGWGVAGGAVAGPVALVRGAGADPADPEHGPVAVLSGHTNQKAATAALGKARGRVPATEGERLLLQVRTTELNRPGTDGGTQATGEWASQHRKKYRDELPDRRRGWCSRPETRDPRPDSGRARSAGPRRGLRSNSGSSLRCCGTRSSRPAGWCHLLLGRAVMRPPGAAGRVAATGRLAAGAV